MTTVLQADETAFNELLASSSRPILVDFAASWCGPCKAMAPAMDAFAAEREDVAVLKVDIDEAPQLAMKYRVRGVPTLAVIHGGEVKAIKSGAMTKSQLESFVNQALA